MPLSPSDFIPAAGQLAGGILGYALEGHEDQRQREQAQALTDIQTKATKDITGYNLMLQKDMWNYTNYENQIKHLKAAGLNPALLYGKGGGGGATAQLTTGSASSHQAAGHSGEIPAQMGMALQMQSQIALQQAQAEALKATAAKDNAQAKKISGVDTEQTQTTIEQIKAQTTNTQAQTALTDIQTKIQEIEKLTQQEIFDKGWKFTELAGLTDKINQEAVKLENENWLFSQQKEQLQKYLKAQTDNIIQNTLKTKLDTQQQELANKQIQKMIDEGYDQWTLEKKYYQIEKDFKDTLIKYMPIDRLLNFVESVSNMKKAFRPSKAQ